MYEEQGPGLSAVSRCVIWYAAVYSGQEPSGKDKIQYTSSLEQREDLDSMNLISEGAYYCSVSLSVYLYMWAHSWDEVANDLLDTKAALYDNI